MARPLANYQGYSRTNTKVKGQCPSGMRRTGGERKYERVGNRFQWVEYSTCAPIQQSAPTPAQQAPQVNVNVSPTFQQSFTPQLSPNFIVGSDIGGNVDAVTGQVAPGGQSASTSTPDWMRPADAMLPAASPPVPAAPTPTTPAPAPAPPVAAPPVAAPPVAAPVNVPTVSPPIESSVAPIISAPATPPQNSALPPMAPAPASYAPIAPDPIPQQILPVSRSQQNESVIDSDWLLIGGAGLAALIATVLLVRQ